MKNLIKTAFFLTVFVLLLSSCDCIEGDGPIVSKTFDEINFDGIELDLSAKVHLTKSEDYKVKIEAQENIMDMIQVYNRAGLLRIKTNKHCVNTRMGINIYISMPELTELEVGGSGEIITNDVFKCKDLKIRINGSGDIDVGAIADYIDCTINGSGGIYLNGESKELGITVRGSGDVEALRSPADKVKVSIMGSGNTKIHAVNYLDAYIAGSGDIVYKGKPEIDSNIHGSGDLRRIR